MLYLPISKNAIGSVLSATDAAGFNAAGDGLRRAEIAALLLIQKSGQQPDPMLSQPHGAHQRHKALERQLAQFIEIGNELPRAMLGQYFSNNCDPDTLQQGLARLNTLKVGLMSDAETARQDYIGPDGRWEFGYRSSQLPQPRRPADEQQRIVADFRANRDEPMHVSGFAGTGKTRLIEDITTELHHDTVLLLAPTEHQLASVAGRLSGAHQKISAMTIGKLASATLREHHLLKYDTDNQGRMMRRLGLGNTKLAEMMGYSDIGDLDARQVADCVARMVSKYCHSADANITLRHMPVEFAELDRQQRDHFKALAEEYWRLLYYPEADIRLPLRDYHLVKMLSLTDLPLPASYSHLIVDEAHELSKPALQILDRASQATITLGDQYQALQRRAAPKRAQGIRQRSMLHSFRAGNNSAPLYNSLIAAHPSAPPGEFEGDRQRKTRISYYERFTIPEQHCAILTRSHWHLFSLMQRLVAANARFHLLPGSRRDLAQLISEALELFHASSSPSHRLLRQYDSWQDFMHEQTTPILQKIDTAFRNGYSGQDLEATLAKNEQLSTADSYIIGRIEDAKNREFSRVMLMPDVLSLEDDSESSRADRINHLYTAISRARDELMLPARMRELVEQAGY